MTATDSLRPALERAARYRFVASLLEPPRPGRQEVLRALARELPEGAGIEIRAVLRPDDEWVGAEYERVFAPRGPISPFASDHVEGGFADKGHVLGDVAGFYRAFGFVPALAEPPDHFASIFAFLAVLAAKQAYARFEGAPEQAEIAENAEQTLLLAYVRRNFASFLGRLEAAAPEGGVLGAYPETIAALLGLAPAPAPAHAPAAPPGLKPLPIVGRLPPARAGGPDAIAYADLGGCR